jgi:hypothetical protein
LIPNLKCRGLHSGPDVKNQKTFFYDLSFYDFEKIRFFNFNNTTNSIAKLKTTTLKAGLHWQLWEAILGGDATFGCFSCSATQLWEIEKFLI